MPVKIKINPTGPYTIQGDLSEVTLIDENGNEYTPQKRSLCRCGGSLTKPYCDSTHTKIGFQGATQAVRESG